MSRHWNPDEAILVSRQQASPRGFTLPVLLVAVVAGIAGGALLSRSDAPRPTAPSTFAVPQKIETVIPHVAGDPADEQWATRGGASGSAASPRASGAHESGVKVAFSSCKWGGGTDCVVDGDTFYMAGAKVRIAGIDAPETHDYRCASELALGERAASRLQALLNSGAVTMTGIGRDRDVYGRLLRNVSVNGQDVGEALIGAGLARAYAGGRRPWC